MFGYTVKDVRRVEFDFELRKTFSTLFFFLTGTE